MPVIRKFPSDAYMNMSQVQAKQPFFHQAELLSQINQRDTQIIREAFPYMR